MTTKPALQSVSILGGLVAIVPTLSNILGYDIGSEEVNAIVTSASAIVGGVMAIYGRVTATDKISGIIPKKKHKMATYTDMRAVVQKKRGRPPKKR
jgi:uncharacterized membrane protein